jgi:hypothetical protein
MNEISFDESLNGFHGYDFDISIQSTLKGFTNYVIFDIKLEHFSRGKTNREYYRNLIKVFRKWENFLPLNALETDANLNKTDSKKEVKRLKKLIKKLSITGCGTEEILKENLYFSQRIDMKYSKMSTLVRIFSHRLFHAPKYIFR